MRLGVIIEAVLRGFLGYDSRPEMIRKYPYDLRGDGTMYMRIVNMIIKRPDTVEGWIANLSDKSSHHHIWNLKRRMRAMLHYGRLTNYDFDILSPIPLAWSKFFFTRRGKELYDETIRRRLVDFDPRTDLSLRSVFLLTALASSVKTIRKICKSLGIEETKLIQKMITVRKMYENLGGYEDFIKAGRLSRDGAKIFCRIICIMNKLSEVPSS